MDQRKSKRDRISVAGGLAAAFMLAFCAPAKAAFEDVPASARQAALGGAGAALEDPAAFLGNPALAGASRKFEAGAGFLGSERTTLGPAEYNVRGAWASVPYGGYGRPGTFAAGVFSREDGAAGFAQRTVAAAWSSWQLVRAGSGALDFGLGLRSLRLAETGGPDSQTGAAVDLGAAYRPDGGRVFGLSALNVGGQSFKVGLLKDNAPRVLKLGYAEKHEDFTLTAELAQRSAAGGHKANFSLAPGAEYLWRTRRAGQFYTRTALSLARGVSAASAGLGWRRQAAEVSYGFSVPLNGAIVPAHAVSLSLRFGDRDVESEYERLMRQEMKYRQDLVEALDEAAKREEMLKKELLGLRGETDSLSELLRSQEARTEQAQAEREKLAGVMRRQQAAEADLKRLEEKRRADKLAQLSYNFSLDWQNYLRMKGGGAPKDVLKAQLERIIGQYQDSGIDISQATLELRELISGR